ncbi:unnamed protein product [Polarella glacialis]|uniref:Poly [ADP-ribose] polymerase n=1 Tax=Polarella glacialis TaxID=89957 RepID=A0A813IEI4_POLGL|nr:unnamed protein product [Polarella glacialis]
MVYVAQKNLAKFQELMDTTYRPIPTQDRPCPTGMCAKVRGGCPCVRLGGSPGLPSGYKVKRVIRIEDSGMFERYAQRLGKIKRSRGFAQALAPSLFTQEPTREGFADVLAPLDSSLNEAYLWHGTTVRRGLAIAQDDFSLQFAGSGAGSMYGEGLYFAESCTKADEYSQAEPGGPSELGNVMKLLEDEVDAEEAAGIENMDVALNELLLWHGTDAESATAIAESGFQSAKAGTVKHMFQRISQGHRRRFGEGAYFAEDLAKSIGYAPESSTGVRYVLLCRTVCGHIWYTEKSSDSDADQDAKRSLKHSVLANPDGKGPREYVLFEDTQIYPEYIVQLSVNGDFTATEEEDAPTNQIIVQ